MRHLIITIIGFLLIGSTVFGQKDRRQENRDRIKALKIAHITEQLDLTAAEAQKFWPLYNAHEETMSKMRFVERRIMRTRRMQKEGFEGITEEESKKMLAEIMKAEKEVFESRQEFRKELKKVIPAKKILKLEFAERTFKQKMLERLKQMRMRPEKN